MNCCLRLAQKIIQGYHESCKPLCREFKLPQTAFDILMFLANNPEYKTASDIVEIRKLKSNLVSVNVDKLVQEGYLQREAAIGDRRKIQLLCTDKAQPIIDRGRELQDLFLSKMLAGTDEQMQTVFYETLAIIGQNMDQIMEDI